MGVATSDGAESPVVGGAQRVFHDVLVQNAVEKPPLLGELGHVHLGESEPHEDSVHEFEHVFEMGVSRHDLIERISV